MFCRRNLEKGGDGIVSTPYKECPLGFLTEPCPCGSFCAEATNDLDSNEGVDINEQKLQCVSAPNQGKIRQFCARLSQGACNNALPFCRWQENKSIEKMKRQLVRIKKLEEQAAKEEEQRKKMEAARHKLQP